MASALDFVRGDASGLRFPVHPAALASGGADFLTRAFRRFGWIEASDDVARIVAIEPCPGGSTGQKIFLTVEYGAPCRQRPTELFVKFSRDFDDEIRDRQRHEMASEVHLARLSRHPGFPIPVPETCFADFHAESGSGILITTRIRYGEAGIEPQHVKCMDHLLDDPEEYYRAIVTALARLSAAHKSGRLGDEVERIFPFGMAAIAAEDRIPYDASELNAQLDKFADLARRAPQLFPDHLTSPAFIARLKREALAVLNHEDEIRIFLHADRDFVALGHWNANIDNAWFWRNEAGALQCGLIDWGRVRQLNHAYALWGCLLAAPLDIWNDHLDDLLELFATELFENGGPRLQVASLRLHLELYVAMIGLAAALVAPDRILLRLPEALEASGPRDPIFGRSPPARNFLHVFTNFLNFWSLSDISRSLGKLVQDAQTPGCAR